MSSTTLYGIANCDKVRRARDWLDERGVDYRFHDFRRDGIERDLLAAWCTSIEWTTLLNRQGTTWRRLPRDQVSAAAQPAGAMSLMLAHPTLIRRPILHIGETLIVGLDIARYSQLVEK